jgi:hypothetical protein
MKLGDLALTYGSSSSSSSTTVNYPFRGILTLYFDCSPYFEFYDFIETTDGNYIAAGAVNWDLYYVVKFNENGVIWSKSYANVTGDGYDHAYNIRELDDGYYVDGYSEESTIKYGSALLMKLDYDGNVVWAISSYSCWADDYPLSVVQSTDSTALIWLQSYYDGGGDLSGGGYTPFLYKINKSDGSLVWTRGFYNDGHAPYVKMIKTTDNSYVVSQGINPTTRICPSEGSYVWWQPVLTKLDSNGNKLWAKRYWRHGVYIIDIPLSIAETVDGGLIMLVSGMIRDPIDWVRGIEENDVYVVKMDSLGVPQWITRVRNCSLDNGYFNEVAPNILVMDDGYIFNCFGAVSTITSSIIKLDLSGNFVWGKEAFIENVPEDIASGINAAKIIKTDDSLIVVGQSSAYAGQGSFIMVQMDHDGNTNNCPYVTDGIRLVVEPGYLSAIGYTSDYMWVDPNTYNWIFPVVMTADEPDVVFNTICNRTYNRPPTEDPFADLCSQNFNYPDRDLFYSYPIDNFMWLGGGQVDGEISNYQLLMGNFDYVYGYTYSFLYGATYAFLGEFEFTMDFNITNIQQLYGDIIVGVGLTYTDTPKDYFIQFTRPMNQQNYYTAFGPSSNNERYYSGTSLTNGQFKIKRDSSNNVYVYMWDSTQWQWNSSTSGKLIGNSSAPLRPLIFSTLWDAKTKIYVDNFRVLSGCDNTTIVT